MKARNVIGVLLICLLVSPLLSISANAAMASSCTETVSTQEVVLPRAMESFSMSVAGKTRLSSDKSMSLAKGETVTISANYSPSNASVDIGVVDADGAFYYINTTNGNFNSSISITKSGKYTLQIRNNSTGTINITGQVNY